VTFVCPCFSRFAEYCPDILFSVLVLEYRTRCENNFRDNHRNRNPPQHSTATKITVLTVIIVVDAIAITTKACIFMSHLLSRVMGFGNKTFGFDSGIDLNCRSIAIVECCKEL